MLNPATRGVPRVPPSRLAAPLHSDFLRGGDLKKGMGGKGEGRLLFKKKEGRDSNTKGTRHSIVFKEWRGSKSICVCPTHPCAHNHPRRFEEHYKTAGMGPLLLIWIRWRSLLDVSPPLVIFNNFRCKSACERVHHCVMY